MSFLSVGLYFMFYVNLERLLQRAQSINIYVGYCLNTNVNVG